MKKIIHILSAMYNILKRFQSKYYGTRFFKYKLIY